MNTLPGGLIDQPLMVEERRAVAARAGEHRGARWPWSFVASTVSSIIGFAFSALCGALLFHVIDNPVYAVQVMIVCSIAIQLYCVANLWQSIDWRSLPVFLIGGFPACLRAPGF